MKLLLAGNSLNSRGFIRLDMTVGWMIAALTLVPPCLALPLAFGVWLPDLSGEQHTLVSATSATGHRVRIVHYWNHVDFYTTEARITSPDGITSTTLIDGDAAKTWSASLEIHPSHTSATYWIPDGRSGTLAW